MTQSKAELPTQVAGIRWYHTIDLGNGVVTPGVDDSSYRLARLGLPESLAGLSVLDVGAWDGFFSFEAERRGAARVLATDKYAWSGGSWSTKAGFDLARRALGSKVEDLEVDVLDLSPERIGTFDVVLFLGVLYHLRDPLTALANVASVSRGLLILETVVDMVGIRRPAAAFYPQRELNNDPTNWWGPNHAAVHGMLRAVGYEHVTTMTPLRSAVYRATRALYHVAKRKASFTAALRQDRAVFHAYKTGQAGSPDRLRPSSLVAARSRGSDLDFPAHQKIEI